ncbi:MAG: IS66 family insertion sequence element accessory protein TnpB [Cyanobacteriota/Melainabacteria group bacterium]
MLSIPASTKIHLCVLPVDMRRSFDSLAELVRTQMGEEPLSGHMFLFRNKSEDKLKVLWWDRDGFALFYKRLEKGKFSLPPSTGGTLEIDSSVLSMLLHGFDAGAMKRQKRYEVSKV